jgi:hypothetical protein
LSRISHDPVLAAISRWIAEDEIRHYKHFYRYFRRYQQSEPANRYEVSCALLNRLQKTNGEDSIIALKHLYMANHPDKRADDFVYRNLRYSSRQLIRPNFPYRMCVQMLLKPLGLSPRVGRAVIRLTETIARRIVP